MSRHRKLSGSLLDDIDKEIDILQNERGDDNEKRSELVGVFSGHGPRNNSSARSLSLNGVNVVMKTTEDSICSTIECPGCHRSYSGEGSIFKHLKEDECGRGIVNNFDSDKKICKKCNNTIKLPNPNHNHLQVLLRHVQNCQGKGNGRRDNHRSARYNSWERPLNEGSNSNTREKSPKRDNRRQWYGMTCPVCSEFFSTPNEEKELLQHMIKDDSKCKAPQEQEFSQGKCPQCQKFWTSEEYTFTTRMSHHIKCLKNSDPAFVQSSSNTTLPNPVPSATQSMAAVSLDNSEDSDDDIIVIDIVENTAGPRHPSSTITFAIDVKPAVSNEDSERLHRLAPQEIHQPQQETRKTPQTIPQSPQSLSKSPHRTEPASNDGDSDDEECTVIHEIGHNAPHTPIILSPTNDMKLRPETPPPPLESPELNLQRTPFRMNFPVNQMGPPFGNNSYTPIPKRSPTPPILSKQRIPPPAPIVSSNRSPSLSSPSINRVTSTSNDDMGPPAIPDRPYPITRPNRVEQNHRQQPNQLDTIPRCSSSRFEEPPLSDNNNDHIIDWENDSNYSSVASTTIINTNFQMGPPPAPHRRDPFPGTSRLPGVTTQPVGNNSGHGIDWEAQSTYSSTMSGNSCPDLSLYDPEEDEFQRAKLNGEVDAKKIGAKYKRCGCCNMEFQRFLEGMKHFQQKHKQKRCPGCLKTFTSEGHEYKKHLEEEHFHRSERKKKQLERIRCKFCESKTYFDYEDIWQHISDVHIDPPPVIQDIPSPPETTFMMPPPLPSLPPPISNLLQSSLNSPNTSFESAESEEDFEYGKTKYFFKNTELKVMIPYFLEDPNPPWTKRAKDVAALIKINYKQVSSWFSHNNRTFKKGKFPMWAIDKEKHLFDCFTLPEGKLKITKNPRAKSHGEATSELEEGEVEDDEESEEESPASEQRGSRIDNRTSKSDYSLRKSSDKNVEVNNRREGSNSGRNNEANRSQSRVSAERVDKSRRQHSESKKKQEKKKRKKRRVIESDDSDESEESAQDEEEGHIHVIDPRRQVQIVGDDSDDESCITQIVRHDDKAPAPARPSARLPSTNTTAGSTQPIPRNSKPPPAPSPSRNMNVNSETGSERITVIIPPTNKAPPPSPVHRSTETIQETSKAQSIPRMNKTPIQSPARNQSRHTEIIYETQSRPVTRISKTPVQSPARNQSRNSEAVPERPINDINVRKHRENERNSSSKDHKKVSDKEHRKSSEKNSRTSSLENDIFDKSQQGTSRAMREKDKRKEAEKVQKDKERERRESSPKKKDKEREQRESSPKKKSPNSSSKRSRNSAKDEDSSSDYEPSKKNKKKSKSSSRGSDGKKRSSGSATPTHKNADKRQHQREESGECGPPEKKKSRDSSEKSSGKEQYNVKMSTPSKIILEKRNGNIERNANQERSGEHPNVQVVINLTDILKNIDKEMKKSNNCDSKPLEKKVLECQKELERILKEDTDASNVLPKLLNLCTFLLKKLRSSLEIPSTEHPIVTPPQQNKSARFSMTFKKVGLTQRSTTIEQSSGRSLSSPRGETQKNPPSVATCSPGLDLVQNLCRKAEEHKSRKESAPCTGVSKDADVNSTRDVNNVNMSPSQQLGNHRAQVEMRDTMESVNTFERTFSPRDEATAPGKPQRRQSGNNLVGVNGNEHEVPISTRPTPLRQSEGPVSYPNNIQAENVFTAARKIQEQGIRKASPPRIGDSSMPPQNLNRTNTTQQPIPLQISDNFRGRGFGGYGERGRGSTDMGQRGRGHQYNGGNNYNQYELGNHRGNSHRGYRGRNTNWNQQPRKQSWNQNYNSNNYGSRKQTSNFNPNPVVELAPEEDWDRPASPEAVVTNRPASPETVVINRPASPETVVINYDHGSTTEEGADKDHPPSESFRYPGEARVGWGSVRQPNEEERNIHIPNYTYPQTILPQQRECNVNWSFQSQSNELPVLPHMIYSPSPPGENVAMSPVSPTDEGPIPGPSGCFSPQQGRNLLRSPNGNTRKESNYKKRLEIFSKLKRKDLSMPFSKSKPFMKRLEDLCFGVISEEKLNVVQQTKLLHPLVEKQRAFQEEQRQFIDDGLDKDKNCMNKYVLKMNFKKDIVRHWAPIFVYARHFNMPVDEAVRDMIESSKFVKLQSKESPSLGTIKKMFLGIV